MNINQGIVKNKKILSYARNTFTDIDYIYNNNKIRELSDTATSIFNNVFMNKDILINYIDYVSCSFNYEILTKLNTKLSGYNQDILGGDELVLFVLKGGNSMLFLKNINCNVYKRFFDSPEFSYIKKYLDDNFSISDCDFNLFIIASNIKRYNILYNTCAELAISSLQKISENMDDIYENRKDKNEADDLPIPVNNYYDNLEIDNDIYLENYNSLSMYYQLYSVFHCLLYVYKNKQGFISEVQKFLLSPYNDIEGTDNFNILCQIFNIYNLINISIEKNNIVELNIINTRILKRKLTNILKQKLNKLVRFYSKDKINNFKLSLVEDLNKLRFKEDGTNRIFYQEENNIIKYYSIPNEITLDDISLENKEHVVIYNKNEINKYDAFDIFKSREKSRHRITVNNIIKDVKSDIIISFELLRIKFYIKLKNKIVDIKTGEIVDKNISSELLDLSILNTDSYEYIEIVKNVENKNIFKSITSLKSLDIKSIILFNNDYIFKDLTTVMFDHKICPFFDKKYKKRIFRYFYFLINFSLYKNEHMTANIKNEIIFHFFNLIKSVKENNKSLFDASIDKIYSPKSANIIKHTDLFMDLLSEVISNNKIDILFTTHKYFDNMKIFINFIITIKHLLIRNDLTDEILQKILTKYQNLYNVKISLDLYRINLNIFINDCVEILNNVTLNIWKNTRGYRFTDTVFHRIVGGKSNIETFKKIKNDDNSLIIKKSMSNMEESNAYLKSINKKEKELKKYNASLKNFSINYEQILKIYEDNYSKNNTITPDYKNIDELLD